MKGVEKVKYITGEESGVDSQDSTVRHPFVVFHRLLNQINFTDMRENNQTPF